MTWVRGQYCAVLLCSVLENTLADYLDTTIGQYNGIHCCLESVLSYDVSQSDKALVGISHCISTSQLEELVHSAICQQVLRLCQRQ